MRSKSILVLVIIFSYLTSTACALTWNILDETYGNGPGQISFNANYDYHGGFMVETLQDGYAELSPGLLGANPCKTSIPGFPVGSDLTIEFKVQAVYGAGLEMLFSETNNGDTSSWNHGLYLNNVGVGSNTLIDKGLGDNIAPDGFDGSTAHVFRLIRQDNRTLFYLFDNEIPRFLCEPTQTGGSWHAGRNLYFGIPSNGPMQVYRFYNMRISSVAEIPEPTTLFLLGMGGLILKRKQ